MEHDARPPLAIADQAFTALTGEPDPLALDADRSGSAPGAINHPPRQHRTSARQHLADPGQPRTALDQLHTNTGVLMRYRHAEIINNRPPGVEPAAELVCSQRGRSVG